MAAPDSTTVPRRSSALADLLTRWPLRYTLPAVLLGGALLIAFFEYQFLLRERHGWLVADTRVQFAAHISVMASEIEAALARDDQAAIDALFTALSIDTTLLKASLRRPDGQLVAASVVRSGNLPPGTAGDNEILEVRHAVRFRVPAASGELYLAYDLAPRLAAMRHAELRHFAYRILLAGGLALLFWVFLDRAVVRRLRSIEHQALRAREGRFDLPIALAGHDEISSLSHVLQQTAHDIGRDRAALVERDRRMEQVVAAADLVVWDLDLTHQRVVLSERWAHMLGRAVGVRDMNISDYLALIDPRDLQAVRDAFSGYVDGSLPSYACEYRLRDQNGGTVWVLDRGTAVSLDAQGRKLRMVGVQLEISARKQADMHHRALLEAIPDLLVVVDAEGIYREYHTVEPREWIGLPNNVVGRKVVDLLPPGPAQQSMDAVAKVLGSGTPVDGQYEIDLPHGHRWREFRMVPYGSAQVLALVRDVTARKQAEEALRSSEGRLRAMIENFPIGMFWCDSEGNTLYANAKLRDAVLLLLRGMPQGWRWLEAVHPDDRERMGQAWRDFVGGARSEYIEECRYVTLHRGVRLVRTWATPIRIDGRVQSYVGAVIDITRQRDAELQQRQLEQQLHHAQKMEALGALTGGIAHDFNNILASMLGFAGLARQYFVTDPNSKLATYLDTVLAAGERGRELVTKMLTFSRARAGEAVMAVDPEPALHEVVGMLRAILPSTIELKIDIEAGVPAILVDPTELHQLVVNLAVNARDAIDGHGQISIQLSKPATQAATCNSCQQHFDGSYVELCVRDTGGALPAEVLARMFEPFFSTKEVGQGTGLGLAVVHGVMHRSGGHVLVESNAALGTRMRLLFRVAPYDMVPRVPPAQASRPLAAARILLVDDEEQVAQFLSELLRAEGHSVDSYTRPTEALAAFQAAPAYHDVLITDQTMPGMTGIELAAAVHAQRASLPVVLCSGYSEQVNADNYSEFGLHSYCAKPVTSACLMNVLGEALARARAPAVSSAGREQ